MEENEKYLESLLKTFGHLMGLQTNCDGELTATEGWEWEEGENSGRVELESIDTGPAKKWEAGALLKTVSELNILPSEKVGKIRSSIEQVRKKVPPKSDSPTVPPQNAAKPAEQDPFSSSRPGGFYPPRKRDQPPAGNEEGRKQFTFTKSKPAEETCPPPSNSLWTEYPPQPAPKKIAVGTGTYPSRAEPSGRPETHQGNTGSWNRPGALPPPSKPLHPSTSVEEASGPFRSAYQQLLIDDKRKGIQRNLAPSSTGTAGTGRALGLRRPPARTEPPPPPPPKSNDEDKVSDNPEVEELMTHELMKNVDAKMVEAILNEVIQVNPTTWADIAGLDTVKKIIREIIIWPMERPDIFVGLRAAPKGILFFGPPGTGKTMFGRVIATESRSTFFNISASSLTSKWIGDGEKMVRALFAVARVKAPSVIFIDEIDSIMTARSDTEHESSRRMKTEFLVQFDGCGTTNDERILVIGVTNRPQELDDAARRRLVKRIYIPLPDFEARKQLIKNLVRNYDCNLSESDFNKIAKITEGYSGADMNSLCREAAMGPLRDVATDIQSIDAANIRPISIRDFGRAQRQVKSSVAQEDVKMYEDWDVKFGCHMGPTQSSGDESFEFLSQDL